MSGSQTPMAGRAEATLETEAVVAAALAVALGTEAVREAVVMSAARLVDAMEEVALEVVVLKAEIKGVTVVETAAAVAVKTAGAATVAA